ncbi:MAG: serpin family protein [Dethiobacter sp.]|nr:serpin family protein [Dethiobacter sp.]
MQRKITWVIIFLLLILAASLPLIGGCGVFNRKESLAAPVEQLDGRLVEANNGFGFDLLHELRKKDPKENIFISPASVIAALAMTYNGAAGETSRAMAEVTRLEGMTLPEINRAFSDLKTILHNPDPKVELTVANSLWARKGIVFNEDFLQRNRDYFDAEVTETDFALNGAADIINRWVNEQTRGKIEKIVQPPIDPMTVLFLINAIYFKGEWSEPFDPEKTRNIPFTLADGTVKQHPLMFREDDLFTLQTEQFQAVSLPYGKNERVSMYLFLPHPDSSLSEFYGELNLENWNSWIDAFTERKTEIGLPRFKFAYETSLKQTLKALGMEVAFDETAADFSGMLPIPPTLYISDVQHKTFVEVNEKGTEAAAVTSVEMRVTSMPELFTMIIDRPFFFAIADNQTGTILFMGSVSDPSAG